MVYSLRPDQLCCRGVTEIPSAAAGAAAEEASVYLLPGEDGHQRQEHDQAGHRMQGKGISCHEITKYPFSPVLHFPCFQAHQDQAQVRLLVIVLIFAARLIYFSF